MIKQKKVFVVLTHMVPVPGTEVHTYQDEGYRMERCEVVSRVTNKQMLEASFIIDAVNSKVIKSRNKALNYNHIYDYFKRRYPAHDAELLKLLNPGE